MRVTLLTPPASEPLTLAEARAWLRMDDAEEDTLIADLIRAARETVETLAGRRLITQGWRITRDFWPADGCIHLTEGPVLSLDTARLAGGAGTVLPPTAFRLDGRRRPPLIEVVALLPPPVLARDGIELDITCGYGPAPEDVPETLRQAMRLLVANWFENRGDAAARAETPGDVAALVAPFRMPRL